MCGCGDSHLRQSVDVSSAPTNLHLEGYMKAVTKCAARSGDC